MKKTLLIIAVLMIATLSACGSKEEQPKTIERDLKEAAYEEMGEGTFYLATAGGTSEDGNVPVVYVSPDTSLKQIGLNTSEFNGGSLSFVYVDGILLDKTQLVDSQITLNLEKEQLTVGVHKVEVVQYSGDDTSAEMTTYKTASYEIKSE